MSKVKHETKKATVEAEQKTAQVLQSAYQGGQRHFANWDFVEDLSLEGMGLSGAVFEDCFMNLDFSGANLERTKFIRCNLKCASFQNAQLKYAEINDCCVEGIELKGAKIEGLRFENNGYFGFNLTQKDIIKLL